MTDNKVEYLGQLVADVVSGFKGRVTAESRYLHGETRVEVTPIDDPKADPRWFDAGRVVPA